MIEKYQKKLNPVRDSEGKQILQNKQISNRVNKILEKNDVVLAYLFGSAAKGKMGPLSDIDIAVLFSEKVKEKDYFDKRLKMASEIDRVLGVYKTEVVCLNQAPPLLKHRAIFYGNPIFVSDRELKRIFEFQVLQEYEDFKYHLETGFKIMERQIKEGTFGKPIISPHHSKIIEQYETGLPESSKSA